MKEQKSQLRKSGFAGFLYVKKCKIVSYLQLNRILKINKKMC
jgi:hypothetical protein